MQNPLPPASSSSLSPSAPSPSWAVRLNRCGSEVDGRERVQGTQKAARMSGLCNWWRCGELDPGPNPAKKESLRRVVSVIFKAGCEERGRNHSYPIPYLDVPVGSSDIDSADNSAHASDCRSSRSMNVARRWSLDFREREREVRHTEVWRLHACKSILSKYVSLPF